MAIHTIKVRIKDKDLRDTLEELMAEQISDEFGINIFAIKGMRKTIKADAAVLFPRFHKAILKELARSAEDGIMDALDNVGGWRGAWKPLDTVVDKYGRDTILAGLIEEEESERKINQLKKDAANLGFEVVDLLA